MGIVEEKESIQSSSCSEIVLAMGNESQTL